MWKSVSFSSNLIFTIHLVILQISSGNEFNFKKIQPNVIILNKAIMYFHKFHNYI